MAATRKKRRTKRRATTVSTYKPKAAKKTTRRRSTKRGLMASVKPPLNAVLYGAGGGAVYALGSNYLTGLNRVTRAAVGFGAAFLVSYMFNPLAGTGIAGATAADITRSMFGLSEGGELEDNEYISADDLQEGEIFVNDQDEVFALNEGGDMEFVGMADELDLSEYALSASSGYGYNA